MKNKKRLKVVAASLFVLISLVLLISQIDNNNSVSTEVSLVDSTSLIAASVIPVGKPAIITATEEGNTIKWVPFEINQVEKGNKNCIAESIKNNGQYIPKQIKDLAIFNKKREITDTNNLLGIVRSSKAYAEERLKDAEQTLKTYNEIKAGELYTFIVYPIGVEVDTSYEKVGPLRNTCVGYKTDNEVGGNKVVGTIGEVKSKLFSDDPEGYKNLKKVTELWQAFYTNNNELGLVAFGQAGYYAGSFDISFNNRKEISDRDKIIITVVSESKGCFNVKFLNRKGFDYNSCPTEEVRKKYDNLLLNQVLIKRVTAYKEAVKNYNIGVSKLVKTNTGLNAQLAALPN